MPRVSVIIPTYNQAEYIIAAIDSVLNQTYQDFEIIITNDGSTDQTLKQIQQKQDSRIQLFSFDKNQGVSVAANTCILQATGEFIAILDSDDIFELNKLEKQVHFLEDNQQFAAVLSHAQIIDQKGNLNRGKDTTFQQLFSQQNRDRFQWLNYFFYQDNCLCNTSALIRRSCYQEVGLYNPVLRQVHDLDFWVRLCLNHSIYILSEPLVKVRRHHTNISGVTGENIVRHQWEIPLVLQHYLSSNVGENFFEIFPNQKQVNSSLNTEEIHFLIANLALQVQRPSHQLFGINTLYKLMANSEIAKQIENNYNFNYTDLIQLAGKHDPFQIHLNRKLRRDLNTIQKQLDILENKYKTLQEQVGLKNNVTQNQDESNIKCSLPLVSILIPTYNGSAFLSKAIESALTQTYPHLEIIIVDDGSTDSTLEIVNNFKHKASIPYQVITHPNFGLVKNLNFCIQQAQGKYIKFIFQDDWLEPNCIEELVNLAKQDQDIGLVFSSRQVSIDENSKSHPICQAAYRGAIHLHKKWSKLQSIQLGQELLSDPNCLVGTLNKIGEPTTVLISKQVFKQIGGFDPNLQQLLDVDLWFRIMGSYKIGFVDQPLSHLLIHKQQQTQKNIELGENYKDYERLYLKMIVDPSYSFLSSNFRLKILQKTLVSPPFYSILISKLLDQYHQEYNDYAVENLKLVCQALAQYWLTLSPEEFESKYFNEILPNYNLLMKSGLVYEEVAPPEPNFINQIQQQLSEGIKSYDLIPCLIVIMLFKNATQIPNIYKNAVIPKYCFAEFITWLFSPQYFFKKTEQIEQSIQFRETLLEYILGWLSSNQNNDLVGKYIIQRYILLANHQDCLVTEVNSKRIFSLQSKLIESVLDIQPPINQSQLQDKLLKSSKIRLGIFIETLGYNPDTVTAIPLFEFLEQSQFEIFLYCFQVDDPKISDYCYQSVNQVYCLSRNLADVISCISQHNLDIFIIASNATKSVNLAYQMIAHRLAAIQIISSVSSPLPSGLKNVDYRLVGDLIATEVDKIKHETQEQVLTVKNSGICFSYPVELPQPHVQVSRSSWDATKKTVILIATANLFTLIPELRETWTEIIALVPNSILVICPKQTEEDTQIFPVVRRRMHLLFEHHNLDKKRLVMTFLPSWTDVKQAVGLADIYLEPFTGNHPISLVQALSAGVPPIVKQGSASHTKTASAILQELGLTELVTDCSQNYLKQAIALATQAELRQHYHQRLQNMMHNHPQLLDSRGYSQQIGALLTKLIQQSQLKEKP